MLFTNEDMPELLTPDELDIWNFILFCIEENYKREVNSRVLPLYSDALHADGDRGFELAALLRDIADRIVEQLQQEKSDKIDAEMEGFLVTLRDRERGETIERLQQAIVLNACDTFECQ